MDALGLVNRFPTFTVYLLFKPLFFFCSASELVSLHTGPSVISLSSAGCCIVVVVSILTATPTLLLYVFFLSFIVLNLFIQPSVLLQWEDLLHISCRFSVSWEEVSSESSYTAIFTAFPFPLPFLIDHATRLHFLAFLEIRYDYIFES